MCGRFTLRAPREVLVRELGLDDAPVELAPRYNAAPGQEIATVWQTGEGRRELRLRRWGLVPAWARDARIGHRLVNARAETAATRPAFREALRRRRCLVPADGFYEWAGAGRGARQPFHVSLPGRALFAIAGLFERWRAEDGGWLETCVLLTAPASEALREVHDRMPVILERRAFAPWLDPELRDPQRLLPLLGSWSGPLELRRVGPRVNRPEHDDPACLEEGPGASAPGAG